MAQDYLTVTALTKYLKRKFEADPYLERVYLTGEISNFRPRANAHQYFSLKDDGAKISAIMFKGAFQKIKFKPEEGMKVLVVGRISLYEASGNYQIYIEHMEPDGVGALYQAYEQLKAKLLQEGLFDLPKQPLPRFPKRIAVVTSPSGAVIRDIITTARRRYPIAQIVLYPTLVQGEQAADDIAKNIKRADEADFDVMIIGRGGGSIEDLWPFNEELVARTIAEAKTPIISSVGHETDTTIADLVADVRAATPTAAAELAVPVLTEEVVKIKEKRTRLEQALLHLIKQKEQQYQRLRDAYVFRQPERLYEAQSQKLDQLGLRLGQTMRQLFLQKREDWQLGNHRLQLATPKNRVLENKQRTLYADKALRDAMERLLEKKKEAFYQDIQALDLLSPLKIMQRGYTYTTKESQVLKSVAELAIADEITVHFADGQVQAQVMEKEQNHE